MVRKKEYKNTKVKEVLSKLIVNDKDQLNKDDESKIEK